MKAVYNITYGLYVITANTSKQNGCISNTLCQVTTNPNRVTITLNKQNYTTSQILSTGKFNVSILDMTSSFEIIKHFGFSCGKDTDKFSNFSDFDIAENGIYYIKKHTNSYLSCKVVDSKDLGTHIQFLADVEDDKVLSNEPSITYAYYQAYLKPKSTTTSVAYVCSVCGYVYQGDELPEDYICPICKHDKSVFEKQKQSRNQNKKNNYVCPVCGYNAESETEIKKCIICGATMQKKTNWLIGFFCFTL